jgi:hypothetical protein
MNIDDQSQHAPPAEPEIRSGAGGPLLRALVPATIPAPTKRPRRRTRIRAALALLVLIAAGIGVGGGEFAAVAVVGGLFCALALLRFRCVAAMQG